MRGVRTTPSGLDRDRQPTGDYAEPTDLTAKVTVIAEGTRGLADPGLARVAAGRLGQPADLRARREGGVGDEEAARVAWSTPSAGRCRTTPSAGASCIRWGRARSRSASWSGSTITTPALDVHELLQRMKLHPLFRPYLEGGELLEWGAKTIPEGGYLRAPRAPESATASSWWATRSGSWTSHRSRASTTPCSPGIYAARAAFAALKAGDHPPARLAAYDRDGGRELHRGRHVPDPEHAPRVQGRLLCRRPQGRAHDDHAAGGSSAGRSTCRRTPPTPRRAIERRALRRPTASSRSASWTRCSSRETRRGTPSPHTCWSGRT